jgi:hypothetical protein
VLNPRFISHKIFLEKDYLSNGENTITIDFVNTYVTNSAGLHWYKDPADD